MITPLFYQYMQQGRPTAGPSHELLVMDTALTQLRVEQAKAEQLALSLAHQRQQAIEDAAGWCAIHNCSAYECSCAWELTPSCNAEHEANIGVTRRFKS